jgi:glutamine synthetase
VPRSDPAARRVENRIPSSDANPYLALAASLACGLIGLIRTSCRPEDPGADTTANEDEIDLPRGLLEAVDLFENDPELRKGMLGDAFVSTYAAIKKAEFETFMEVISPWEREFLLLNV